MSHEDMYLWSVIDKVLTCGIARKELVYNLYKFQYWDLKEIEEYEELGKTAE